MYFCFNSVRNVAHYRLVSYIVNVKIKVDGSSLIDELMNCAKFVGVSLTLDQQILWIDKTLSDRCSVHSTLVVSHIRHVRIVSLLSNWTPPQESQAFQRVFTAFCANTTQKFNERMKIIGTFFQRRHLVVSPNLLSMSLFVSGLCSFWCWGLLLYDWCWLWWVNCIYNITDLKNSTRIVVASRAFFRRANTLLILVYFCYFYYCIFGWFVTYVYLTWKNWFNV